VSCQSSLHLDKCLYVLIPDVQFSSEMSTQLSRWTSWMRRRAGFFESYLDTLIECDVQEITAIERTPQLRKLLHCPPFAMRTSPTRAAPNTSPTRTRWQRNFTRFQRRPRRRVIIRAAPLRPLRCRRLIGTLRIDYPRLWALPDVAAGRRVGWVRLHGRWGGKEPGSAYHRCDGKQQRPFHGG
jgi:hypothetical protein